MRQDLPLYCLGCLLLVFVLFHAVLFIPVESGFKRATYSYAQGYDSILPRIGGARIVPLASWKLKSPVYKEKEVQPKTEREPKNPGAY